MKRALALAVLAATLAPVHAQVTVYRCGPDGREYSDTPCRQGRAIDVADPRTDEERSAAREVAARDARLAARLRQERQKRQEAEAQAARHGAAGLHLAPRRDAGASGYENVEQIRRKLKRMERMTKPARPRKGQARTSKPRPPARGTSPTASPSSRRAAD